MSDDPEPSEVAHTQFPARPQLTRATTQKGEIRFELELPTAYLSKVFACELSNALHAALPRRQDRSPPAAFAECDPDRSHTVVVIYRPDSPRDFAVDSYATIGALASVNVPVTSDETRVIRHAFNTYRELSTPEHGTAAAAQLARRAAKERGQRGGR